MGNWWIQDGDRSKKSTNGTWYVLVEFFNFRVLVEKPVPVYEGMVFKVSETVFKVDLDPLINPRLT
jgi:hypothetical protein